MDHFQLSYCKDLHRNERNTKYILTFAVFCNGVPYRTVQIACFVLLRSHTCTLGLILADSGFLEKNLYQGSVKSRVSWVFKDLKFKISEGYDQKLVFS